MDTFWRTLGRAVIKLLVSLLAAIGVGVLVFAGAIVSDPGIWQAPNPPVGLFVAIAAGLFTAAVLLAVFFLLPSRFNRPMSTRAPIEAQTTWPIFRRNSALPTRTGKSAIPAPRAATMSTPIHPRRTVRPPRAVRYTQSWALPSVCGDGHFCRPRCMAAFAAVDHGRVELEQGRDELRLQRVSSRTRHLRSRRPGGPTASARAASSRESCSGGRALPCSRRRPWRTTSLVVTRNLSSAPQARPAPGRMARTLALGRAQHGTIPGHFFQQQYTFAGGVTPLIVVAFLQVMSWRAVLFVLDSSA